MGFRSITSPATPNISIHALREEGDDQQHQLPGGHCKFLSTPSARRATVRILNNFNNVELFLSTPSARRATEGRHSSQQRISISIHALREEGDRSDSQQFQQRRVISIHALREEGD